MSKPDTKGASAVPYSVLNTVEALLQQAIQLLEIQRQTLIAPAPQSSTPQKQQELMDVKETAEYLGVSEWSLRNSYVRSPFLMYELNHEFSLDVVN